MRQDKKPNKPMLTVGVAKALLGKSAYYDAALYLTALTQDMKMSSLCLGEALMALKGSSPRTCVLSNTDHQHALEHPNETLDYAIKNTKAIHGAYTKSAKENGLEKMIIPDVEDMRKLFVNLRDEIEKHLKPSKKSMRINYVWPGDVPGR